MLQTIVRGEGKPVGGRTDEGIPKTSNVARSNSLRSSSPPRLRRPPRSNIPPPLPEGQVLNIPYSQVT